MQRSLRQIRNDLLKNTPGLKDRLEAFYEIVRQPIERSYLTPIWDFNQSMDFIAQRILVVNLNAFEDVISIIRNSLKEAGKTVYRIAKFDYEVNKRTARIVPVPRK